MSTHPSRSSGMVLGVLMVLIAFIAALVFYILQEQMVEQIRNSQQGLNP